MLWCIFRFLRFFVFTKAYSSIWFLSREQYDMSKLQKLDKIEKAFFPIFPKLLWWSLIVVTLQKRLISRNVSFVISEILLKDKSKVTFWFFNSGGNLLGKVLRPNPLQFHKKPLLLHSSTYGDMAQSLEITNPRQLSVKRRQWNQWDIFASILLKETNKWHLY